MEHHYGVILDPRNPDVPATKAEQVVYLRDLARRLRFPIPNLDDEPSYHVMPAKDLVPVARAHIEWVWTDEGTSASPQK